MTNTDPPDEIESPCIKQCTVDLGGICTGCARSLSEIAAWSSASPQAKQTILLQCEQRKAGVSSPDLRSKEV